MARFRRGGDHNVLEVRAGARESCERELMKSDTLTIEAGKSELHYWRDLWRFRELFVFLAWRDLLVRYKQTSIGVAWAVIRPLLTMLILTVVFGKLAGLPSDAGTPYAVMVLVAIVPWQFASSAFSEAAASLVTNASMISKVYFPRMIIPASAVIVSLADLVVSLFLLAIFMAFYGVTPSWNIVALPFLIALAFLAALGAGLWIAALTVRYRDFRYVVPFMVQLGLYVSPIGFSSSIVPPQWRLLYSLNPMVGVIDGFRWAVLGTGPLYLPGLILSVCVVAFLLLSGVAYFRATEKTFADVI